MVTWSSTAGTREQDDDGQFQFGVDDFDRFRQIRVIRDDDGLLEMATKRVGEEHRRQIDIRSLFLGFDDFNRLNASTYMLVSMDGYSKRQSHR